VRYINSHIDSVVMKVNDSIIGCDPTNVDYDYKFNVSHSKTVGSITHRVKFPINVRLQFFSQGDLLKELFFEMDKNTLARVFRGSDCPKDIDSSSDDYCWFIEKMKNSNGNCVEYYGYDYDEYSHCTIYTRPLR